MMIGWALVNSPPLSRTKPPLLIETRFAEAVPLCITNKASVPETLNSSVLKSPPSMVNVDPASTEVVLATSIDLPASSVKLSPKSPPGPTVNPPGPVNPREPELQSNVPSGTSPPTLSVPPASETKASSPAPSLPMVKVPATFTVPSLIMVRLASDEAAMFRSPPMFQAEPVPSIVAAPSTPMLELPPSLTTPPSST